MRKFFFFLFIPTLALAQIGPASKNIVVTTYMKSVLKSQNAAAARTALGVSGSGALSGITVGNLSPLFTTSVTPGPTPAVTFTFSNAGANKVFSGPTAGASATPSYRSLVANDIPSALNSTSFNGAPFTFPVAVKTATNHNIVIENVSSGPRLRSINDANSASMPLEISSTSTVISGGPVSITDQLFINTPVANLFMKDLSSGWQVAATQVITPQSGNSVRNTSFTSGLTGWNIDNAGNAEFNNALIRGELRTSVFKVNEIAATAGTFGVFYSGTTLTDSCTTPASTGITFTFNAKNSDVTASAMMLGIGDIVRMKAYVNSGGVIIADVWATVSARANHTTYTTYTATLSSGSINATIPAGVAVVDYGPTGSGFITQSADGTIGASPNLTMATHSGTPWSGFTTLLRLGNLNGAYGYASNVYGVGFGQYGAAEPWLTFDTTNGIRIGNNTAVLGQWDTSGNILVGKIGSGQANVYITGGAVALRNNATNILSLDTTNGLRIFGSGGAVIGQWDTSGNATFGQVATNKANVFFNNSNQRLEFRGSTSGTVVQSYIDTDGSFVAGGGNTKLNALGLSLATFGTGPGIPAGTTIKFGAVGEIGADSTAIVHVGGIGGSSFFPASGVVLSAHPFGGSLFGNGAFLSIDNNGFASFVRAYGTDTPFTGATIGTNALPTHMLDVYGTIWLQNSSAPATPTGGGVIYVEGGALKYKGSSGTVTPLGNP